jgi:3-oxoacyl-[acyl-carrier-protein] synthase II
MTPLRTIALRRVVVTGMGIVSPLGIGVEHVWRRLIAGDSGISAIQSFDVSDLPAKVAGEVPAGLRAEGGLDLAEWIPVKDMKKMDRFIQLGLVAAIEAVEDAGWMPEDEEDRCATGVMIGSGIGGLQSIYDASVQVHEGKVRRLSPFFIPSALINLVSGHVSIRYGFKGPNHSAVTACATGVHAIGDAARLISLGEADVMVAGGAEAAVCALGIGGFCASRALSTGFNDEPGRASRPWDRDRDGFVMGEGAGVLVLEEYEHAKKRGAKIYAEIGGYGLSGDAHHITAPAEGHDGAFRAMKAALRNGGVDPSEIQYVNAHGTSTPLGDDLELSAVERFFGDHARTVAMSSTKSATGHLLGAAGAIEAVFSILAIRDGVAPPTLNLEEPSRDSVIDRVAKVAQARPIKVALSNSFGFGGTNASVILPLLVLLTVIKVGFRYVDATWNGIGPLPQQTDFVVPHGPTEVVGEALQQAGIIDGVLAFRVAVRLTDSDGPLHAGEFGFPANASFHQVLDILRHGRQVEHHLTIPEGLTAEQIAALINAAPAMTGIVTPPAEGMILPNTYDYLFGASRQALLHRA